MTKTFAGRAKNYHGENVIAIHLPNRKYRVLLTEPQYVAMKSFCGTKVPRILSPEDYKRRRKAMRSK
jgi:hypothetical protein